APGALDGVRRGAPGPPVIEVYFGTGPLTEEWWEKVVEFGTVDGLCHALARVAQLPLIEPLTVLGRPCPAAGAFLLIRRMLAEAGADVSRLRPSTPLIPYIWLWPEVFRWQLPRLAPGRGPAFRVLNRPPTRR